MIRRLSAEGGAVLILVMFALPVLLGFGIFAVDVGNWWVHKRHLQTQADAAALAGAMKFQFPGCSDAAIEETAVTYSGGTDVDHPGVDPLIATAADGTLLGNFQVDRRGKPTLLEKVKDIHTEINEATAYGRTAADYEDPDFAGKTDAERAPCNPESLMVDVKMTESDLPWFLKVTGIVEWIDAHARVELKQLASFAGMLPLGVEEVSPRRVRIWVYDEDTGEQLGSAALWQRFTTDAEGKKVPYSEDGLLIFDNKVDAVDADGNPAVPLTLDMKQEVINGQTVRKERLGVKVALSGSTSTSCTDALVVCYGFGEPDGLNADVGLTRIRGWDPPTGDVRLGEVALVKKTCASNSFGLHDNGYFSTTCTEQEVQVELPGVAETGPDTATVKATVDWRNNTKDVTLAYSSTLDRWVGTLPVDPVGEGTRSIEISWKQTAGTVPGKGTCKTNNNSNPCKDVYPDAHKLFSGSREYSGPIKELRVDVGANLSVNNVPRCGATETCPQTFTFRIGTAGRLALAQKGDDPVSLKLYAENATEPSQSQGLNCDQDEPGFEQEVADGCGDEYRRNTGTVCPNTKTELWALPQPWDCVALQTGNYENKISKGLNERILCRPPNSVDPPNCNGFGQVMNNGGTCTNPNNWPTWPKGDSRWDTWTGVPEGDPRVVPLFLVPFGAFGNPGSGTVPVVDFAFFYVTGWTSNGQGFNNPCKNYALQPDVFVPGTEDEQSTVSGYFIKYVTANTGGSGGEKCVLDAITGCVAVMTK